MIPTHPYARRKSRAPRLLSARSAQTEGHVPQPLREMDTRDLARAMGRWAKENNVERTKVTKPNGDEITVYSPDDWEKFAYSWTYGLFVI